MKSITEKAKSTDSTLRNARVVLKMSPEDAAAAIGVTKNTYLQWERGAMKPKPAKVQKIGEVLHLSPEEIPAYDIRKPVPHPSRKKICDITQLARAEKYAPYRKRRLELGLTQKKLAEMAGVKEMAVSDMECGTHEPMWETRQKIRKALGWPEERYFTVEERNAEFLRMNHIVYWVLNHHRQYFLDADVDLEDAYQDLALCALRAIDRFDPNAGTKIETYLITQLKLEAKNIRARAIAKGLTYRYINKLPYNTVVSLEALTDAGMKFEAAA